MNNRRSLSGIAILLLVGCASAPPAVQLAAERAAEDYADARADGVLDEAETRRLDRDFGWIQQALDESPPGFSPPATGIPWVDLLISLGTAAVAGVGAHKWTMSARDRARTARGERT
jgi:hypothetical protein